MELSALRIVFLGTPDFAVASLDALVQAGCNIVGVITAPDKPAGRGMKLTESPVKKYAVSKALYIMQPEKLKNPVFLEELKSLKADVQVVVAFRMLPVAVWDMPPMGTINVHGSLLPQYRGAAPINWAIINGEKETGVTTFKLQHAIDTGDILLQTTIPIGENETAGQLHDRMMLVGAETLASTMKGLLDGTAVPVGQQKVNGEESTANVQQLTVNGSHSAVNGELKHAPKIFTETCQVNWAASTETIHNLIRGLSPYPTAFTFINEKKLKIFAAAKELVLHNHENGEVFTDHKTYLKYSCADGYIHITDLQLEGKKRMLVEEFLRGFRL
ncbi:methionyl-tRNA formyltransferase [Parasediminibacterium sp. JCM 36343]|uniref:methionyl-tRNA formyltransferase n=1 Tax=Parasediminibacterium sp. JCM 36343 TaxID=3374279 RepID=UPI003979F4CD